MDPRDSTDQLTTTHTERNQPNDTANNRIETSRSTKNRRVITAPNNTEDQSLRMDDQRGQRYEETPHATPTHHQTCRSGLFKQNETARVVRQEQQEATTGDGGDVPGFSNLTSDFHAMAWSETSTSTPRNVNTSSRPSSHATAR